MRILWLSHFVPFPPAGGALQRSFHLLRHATSHHDVHLLALNQPRLLSGKPQVVEAEKALADLCRSVTFHSLPSERSRVSRAYSIARALVGPHPFEVVWMRSDAMRRSLVSLLREAKPDLIHVDTVGLWPHLNHPSPSPVVLVHHNIESDLIARRAAFDSGIVKKALIRREGRRLNLLEENAARAASMNVVVSRRDEKRLLEMVPEASVEVVENGVDTEHFRPGRQQRASDDILFAGTLGWFPNRDAIEFFLADVWPQLTNDNPNRRLLLVGRDPPALARSAAQHGRVQVTGFVPDVRPFFETAGVFVCPIRVGSGTRLKVLDALAMAKPVVSTTLGIEGLDLVESKHYLRADTAEEFVAQIHRLDRDPRLRASLGNAGRQWVVERYDWRVVGRQLDTAYARAMGPNLAGGQDPVSRTDQK